jgi:DNA mismatch repair protein MutS2
MQQKYERILEYPKILSRLAEYTSFSAGRDLALDLQPYTDYAQVRYHQRETSEAKELLDVRPDVTIGGTHDVRPLVQDANLGAMLEPDQLLRIRSTLESARRLRRILVKLRDRFPTLAEIAELIEPCPHLVERISQCISDQGEILNSASADLARIRRQVNATHDRLLDRLNKMVASSDFSRYLQEALVTVRGGRYVLPIKAEHKARVPGIVHDQSGSGATLFVEPLATVELNNRWRQLQLEEEEEIQRILSELGQAVSAEGTAISITVAQMAQLDLALAKANYSYALKGVEPHVIPRDESATQVRQRIGVPPGTLLQLRKARHPLLPAETVVPIDIRLGGDFQSLVITGPNTGGKTVTLKTVGLLTLMTQAGLHIPAQEDSAITLFDGVYADIGDEQSIEQNLSTFSSHMTNIIDILQKADNASLVLLDELGAGTDPVEGSALARALLSHLLERDVPVVSTTHYSELKLYAHSVDGIENASVEFDLETLAPTYHLVIGLPGRSQALAIASRLGLSSEIITSSRQWISEEEIQADEMLQDIKVAQEEAVADRRTARILLQRAKKREQDLRERTEALEEAREELINKARAEAQRELEAARKRISQIEAQFSADALDRELVEKAEQELKDLVEEAQPVKTRPKPPPRPAPDALEIGDTVYVPSLQQRGKVTELEDSVVEVSIGQFRVRVRASELQKVEQPMSAEAPEEKAITFTAANPDQEKPGIEFDIRGLTGQEAMPRVEKFLDNAYLAGLPWVRIIHGKGTGTLRRLVRERLADHPLVTEFRSGERGEGDTGVTVAQLVRND